MSNGYVSVHKDGSVWRWGKHRPHQLTKVSTSRFKTPSDAVSAAVIVAQSHGMEFRLPKLEELEVDHDN